MSLQEDHYRLSLPIADMVEAMDYSPDGWGKFNLREDGKIGSMDPDEIPGIAQSFVGGCLRAIKGAEQFENAIRYHTISVDIDSLKTFDIFRKAFPESDVVENINRAMKAFEALINPELQKDLQPESVAAARTLVSYLNRISPHLIAQEWADK